MCRLLAYASRSDRSVTELLGDAGFASLEALSALHGDGWGMAWSTGRGPATTPGDGTASARTVLARRSTTRALDDPAFAELARTPLGRSGLVHLRWATPGFEVCEENTHPFVHDNWAFAHNGTIVRAERLDGVLSPGYRRLRRGSTDSERYFLLLLEQIERAGDMVGGICEAVALVRATCGQGSLNAVLLSNSMVAVVHGRGSTPSPRDLLIAATGGLDQLPPDHLDRYYGLRYRGEGGALVVASTGIAGPDWRDVPEDSVLVADYRHQRIGICSLEDPSSLVALELPDGTGSWGGGLVGGGVHQMPGNRPGA